MAEVTEFFKDDPNFIIIDIDDPTHPQKLVSFLNAHGFTLDVSKYPHANSPSSFASINHKLTNRLIWG